LKNYALDASPVRSKPIPTRKGNTMHAVVVKVTIRDLEAAEAGLQERVVPTASGAPGFVAGYWVRFSEREGMGLSVFESEEAAKAAAAQPPPQPPGEPPVTVDSIEVGEVVASA
jgi:hypothetical protein